MKISLLKDYNVFDAGSKPSIEKLLQLLQINESQVIIDLSKCIIDYPATSILIDRMLNDINKLPSPKKLTIQTHLDILELLLLHWLFIGSSFFKIESSQRKNQLDEFKTHLNKQLIDNQIIMEIEVLNKENQVIRCYKYGEQ